MTRAVAIAVVLVASGCQLVFPFEFQFDPVPHVPAELETLEGIDTVLTIPDIGTAFTIDTQQSPVEPGALFDGVQFDIVRQTDASTDVVVMRVRELHVEGVLNLVGTRPFVVVADTIVVTESGTIDAGARGIAPGPGGSPPGAGLRGEGGAGIKAGGVVDGVNHSGGGGGAFADGGGDGGEVNCANRSIDAAGPGAAFGTPELLVLEGGGAGGAGGFDCTTASSSGGGGGGALQLSAFVSITIDGNVLAGGGGGEGGIGGGVCPAKDGAGSGGGAGGAIYLDAPTISNSGLISATGGGGGGGGNGGNGGNGIAGGDGRPGTDSEGGTGVGKGTPGGAGATVDTGGAGISGTCSVTNVAFNTGGGGGAFGRIVFRGVANPVGTVRPTATDLPH